MSPLTSFSLQTLPPGSLRVSLFSYFKVVLQEVVRLPKVLLVFSIVQPLTGGVIPKLPPLTVVHWLTLAPIIPGIIHALGFSLGQNVVPT